MIRAYYQASIDNFLMDDPTRVLGELANHHEFALDDLQRYAWNTQIRLLQSILAGKDGHIYFEFSIPRMGKRVDVLLLINGCAFVIEFKVGEGSYTNYATDQVMDYALDLKNFHETSHTIPIIPILVATEAFPYKNLLTPYEDRVYRPLRANKETLLDCLNECIQSILSFPIHPMNWIAGQYHPTPTIVEAAQALYRGHSVYEISRSEASGENLRCTSDAIDEIIANAKQYHQKSICFITGVPGAGKTLAGLNIANHKLKIGEDEHAVFLSGNGPLVIVLREALVRDEIVQKKTSRKESERKARAFIQNIHTFRDEYYQNQNPPLEKVVVFDEAQRAWSKEMAADFMKRKRGILQFGMSEPEFLISVMDRHEDWAVIICLIGGGQEINKGEAGLMEWFRALKSRYRDWKVYISGSITDSEYFSDQSLSTLLPLQQYSTDKRLHLAVSVRSFRSEKVSAFVKAILDHDLLTAKSLYGDISLNYPILLTRDIDNARRWLVNQARGTERYGLLATSGAMRLRPAGIYVKSKIDVAHWFLDSKDDIRSSYALEEVATEFDIQGLELDWTIVAWDADLRNSGNVWEYKSFSGSKWQTIKDDTRKQYLKNSYRVLLTRARQGMVIFIPYGNDQDITRQTSFYDCTFNYLTQIGIKSLESL